MRTRRVISVFILMGILLAACSSIISEDQKNIEQVVNSSISSMTIPSSSTTTPTNDVSMKPDAMIRVSGRDRYELMKAAVTDDAALEEYLATDSSSLLNNREDIISFLKLMHSIPVFSVEDATYVAVNYTPAKESLHIVYRLSEEAQMHWYRFEYILNKDENAERRNSIKQEVGTKVFDKVGKSKNIDLLKAEDIKTTESVVHMFRYRVEVDEMLISIVYKNAYTDVGAQKVEEVFSPVNVEETFDKAVSESFNSNMTE